MATAEREQRDPIDESRMSIGEHLEELRTRLIRSLTALVVVCVACIWPAKFLLSIIARPVLIVLRKHDQPMSFLQTAPTEAFLMYVKVVVICGLIIAAPYVIYQLWSFVAVGLYKREKAWVLRLVPVSVGLFFAGVVFMYTLVLPVSLNFLVGFGAWFPMPSAQPNRLEQMLIGERDSAAPTSQMSLAEAPAVPVLERDPESPPVGALWFNDSDRKLKLRGVEETFSLQLLRDAHHSMVTTHFKIGEYLTFVLVMTLAFGLAFQMPLVVIFLVRSGIVKLDVMRRSRKIVVLLIVFIAGMLAPPDLMSHLLLSGPMWLLFELGLVLAARKQPEPASD